MNKAKWLKHLERQQKAGKLKNYTVDAPKPQGGGFNRRETRSKGKDFIAWNLPYWCNDKGLTMEMEYEFAAPRKFKFDYAITALKIAIEFEGGLHDRNGSHTSFYDVNRDIEKYNLAQQLGWVVLRYSALNYNDLLKDLNHVYSARV